MKGLVRNSMYSMGNNLKLAFIMAGGLIFAPLILPDNSLYLMTIISVQLFMFIANSATSLGADEISGWNKFELTLPVDKHTVILSKYISFFILILFGFITASLTGVLAVLVTPSMEITEFLWGYQFGLTLSLISTAIMCPMTLKFGTEKSEMILLLSAMTAIVFAVFVAWILSLFSNEMNLRSLRVGMVCISVSPLFWVISYWVSLRIYRKKEF